MNRPPPPPDPWLARWLPLLREKAADGDVLEIGCGHGEDTATLVAAGLRVVAFDLSADAVAEARQRVPTAQISSHDLRRPFPREGGGLGAVVASLSLHYFPWAETVSIAERVRRTLRPGGLLLCRLNALDDVHYGASGHPEIEPHYHLVDGQPKRFFDEADVRRLFARGWRLHACRAAVSTRFGRPKSLWEVAAERA